jgi:hypothetical protein
MVAQVSVTPFGTRHLDVIADGKRFGSIERDNGKFLAKPYSLPCAWFTTQDEAVAHIVQTVGQLRVRWRRALVRAIEEGLDPVQVAGRDGVWFVMSGTDLNVGYLVTDNGASCSCPAGQAGDRVCKHRAAMRYVVGRLALEDEDEGPEPEPPAPAPCGLCRGTGTGWNGVAEVICWKCGGHGQVA